MEPEFLIHPITEGGWKVEFSAMASPCEIIFDDGDYAKVSELASLAVGETKRIEQKFSRYLDSSVVSKINQSAGRAVKVDEETFKLLTFADQCFALSDGYFDITSGVLRQAWRFDGSDRIPQQDEIESLLPRIGWSRVNLDAKRVILPSDMEIDLGGIGKEYAVDKVKQLLRTHESGPALINFGGDLASTSTRKDNKNWVVGIDLKGLGNDSQRVIQFQHGAVATSGDANRYLLKNGIRYSHILNPKSGWPVESAARSITVAAPTCIEAGIVATIAMLSGQDAERFLTQSGFKHWLYR